VIALHFYKKVPQPKNSLVLIHAFPLSREMYLAACGYISESVPDLNIILVDLPGYGDAAVREKWTLNEAMASLHDELKKIGIEKPIIGGTSMGGYAVLSYYRQFPEDVSALVLSNTKAEADTEDAKKSREEFAKDVEARGHEAVYMRMLATLTSRSTKQKHPEVEGVIRKMISSISPASIASSLRALAARDDSTGLLPNMKLPVLIISSAGDELIPSSFSKKMTDNIPGSIYKELQDVGHLTPIEAPKEWSVLISDFLN
jgi:pimeloyl-ACP methyl ester carboxylesterase